MQWECVIVQVGADPIPSVLTSEEEARDWFDRKLASHNAAGYVTVVDGDTFTATKVRQENGQLKERTITIRQVL